MLFAFVAGAGTALSPCVLPILPVVLGAGVTGGNRRPLGVVTGLVLAFAFSAVALVYLIDALGLPNEIQRTIAIVVLLGFGIALLIPPVADRLEALISRVVGTPRMAKGRGLRLRPAARRRARPRLLPLRRPDPRRRDHGLRRPGLHRRQARGRARLRDRVGRRPLSRDEARAPLHRPPRAGPRPRPGRRRRGHGDRRAGDGRRPRPALPEHDRRRPPGLPRQPDRVARGERRRRLAAAGGARRRAALARRRGRRRGGRRRPGAAGAGLAPGSSPTPSSGSTRRAASRSRSPTSTPRARWC